MALWRRCDLVRPWNDPHRDIQRKLAVRPELFLVGVLDGRIVASVMAGYEGHRGWLNYLAVAPDLRRRGYAQAIVAEAERLLREAGCPKINLQIRTSNHGVIEFYRRLIGKCKMQNGPVPPPYVGGYKRMRFRRGGMPLLRSLERGDGVDYKHGATT